jgi:hypothetical protein
MKIYKLVLFSFFTLTFGLASQAQDMEDPYREPSKASKAQHAIRIKESKLCVKSAKVAALVKKAKAEMNKKLAKSENPESTNVGITDKEFKALTAVEKLQYTLEFPEETSQVCDVDVPVQDEDKKIFSQLASNFDEMYRSQRQENALVANKATVLKTIIGCIKKNNEVGLNYKEILFLLKDKSVIPVIIDAYKKASKKDHDILTLCMLLMKEANYEDFLNWGKFNSLYGEEGGYYSFIDLNTDNVNKIIELALAYAK